MIGAVILNELKPQIVSGMKAYIDAVSTRHSITPPLDDLFSVYGWAEKDSMLKLGKPCFYIQPLEVETQGKRLNGGIRDTRHLIAIGYVRHDADRERLEQHLLYMGEAICDWLDGRSIGATASATLSGVGESDGDYRIHFDAFQPDETKPTVIGQVEVVFWCRSEDTVS